MDHKSEIKIFILAGQSNMQGYQGNAEQYPPDPDQLDEKTLLFSVTPSEIQLNLLWTSMKAQTGRFHKGYFGPEVAFARCLVKNNIRPAIFKFTASNTSISQHWVINNNRGLYFQLKEKLLYAISCLDKEKVSIEGFIWIQGESDSKTHQLSIEYYDLLCFILNDIRINVAHNTSLPIIIGLDDSNPFVRKNPKILKAQHSIANLDQWTAFCSMKGLEKADSTHLSPKGLVQHGKRLFKIYNNLRNNCDGINNGVT